MLVYLEVGQLRARPEHERRVREVREEVERAAGRTAHSHKHAHGR